MAPRLDNPHRKRWENPPGIDPLMPAAWVAERWGIHIVSVHDRFRDGKVPGAIRMGRGWRIRLSDVYRYEQSLMTTPSEFDPVAAHEEDRTQLLAQVKAQQLAQSLAREQELRLRMEMERRLERAVAQVALNLRRELETG